MNDKKEKYNSVLFLLASTLKTAVKPLETFVPKRTFETAASNCFSRLILHLKFALLAKNDDHCKALLGLAMWIKGFIYVGESS